MNFEDMQVIEANVIVRAWTDSEFERRLLREPKAAVEEVVGARLPSTLNVVVFRQASGMSAVAKPGVWRIGLPQHPSRTPELRRLDFEDFTPIHACGSDWSCPTTGCCHASKIARTSI